MCLTRIHHDRFTDAPTVVDEVRSRDAALGIEHESLVLTRLTGVMRRVAQVTGDDPVAATLDALASGADLVLGARLLSADGRSVGVPDVLVRLDDGYAPIEVKHHKVLGSSGIDGLVAPLESLTDVSATGPAKFRTGRRRDLLQVAHYRRLLDEAGYASRLALGGVIGSERPYRCVWVDLEAGHTPIMVEYDDYVVAATDAIEHGVAHNDEPLVDPWWRTECTRCDWAAHCKGRLEATSDVTLLSNVTTSVRDRLARDGITTIEQVAAMDPTDDRLPGPKVVLQARARAVGRLLRFDDPSTPLDVPSSPTEVDFDIETYRGQIYLAGFLITANGSSTYEPIIDWKGDLTGERELVRRLFSRLAEFAFDGAVVQHWTDYERRTLEEAGARHGLSIPGSPTVGRWFDDHGVDLCDWTRRNLVSPAGYSLKVIAPLCGFEWRDDDPGGRQSEIWFEQLVDGDDTMRERLLEYNEDDVIAQREIRRWVRRNDSGAGPGTGIPSASTWPIPARRT